MRLRSLTGWFARPSYYSLVAILFIPMAAAAELPKFQIKKLSALGEEASVGTAINDAGQATGYVGRNPPAGFVSSPLRLQVAEIGIHISGRAFRYSNGNMKDLGTLGGLNSFGREINAAGQVTGAASTLEQIDGWGDGGVPHAFLFRNGMMSDLGAFGEGSTGTGINLKAQVAGVEITSEGDGSGFLVRDGEAMTRNDLFAGAQNISVTGLNDSGHVTGFRDLIEGTPLAFVHKNSMTIELGTLGGDSSKSFAINAAGQITGSAGTSVRNQTFPTGIPHAFLYDNGSMTNLGTLGGLTSIGVSINRSGKVTGSADTTGGDEHAFLWDGTDMRDLGTLGGTESHGYAINNKRWVTGTSTTAGDAENHAFLSAGGLMTDLNNLIDNADPLKPHVTLQSGVDINHAGQILVNGRDKRTNKHHAFIASPMEYQVRFITPTTGSRPKVGSSVPVKVALVDINNKRITDARALSLVATPCQVKFSASGAQTKAASCMKYDATNNVFFFNWKIDTAGTGTANIKVTATYQFTVPATVTATQSRTVTITL